MEIDYKGHKITVTSDLRFKVTGPEFEGRRYGDEFASKDKAVEAIESHLKTAAMQKVAEAKIAIPALHGPKAIPFLIRGLNRANSTVLGVPADEIRHYPPHIYDIYPDVPWVKALLEEATKIRGRLHEIAEKLRHYGLRDSSSSGRIQPEDYERRLQTFVDEFNAMKAKAEADAPKQEGP